jgi:hypothetical protein
MLLMPESWKDIYFSMRRASQRGVKKDHAPHHFKAR